MSQADQDLLEQARQQAGVVKVVPIKEDQSALSLWEPICLNGNASSNEVLLLLPDSYELLDQDAEKHIAEVRPGPGSPQPRPWPSGA